MVRNYFPRLLFFLFACLFPCGCDTESPPIPEPGNIYKSDAAPPERLDPHFSIEFDTGARDGQILNFDEIKVGEIRFVSLEKHRFFVEMYRVISGKQLGWLMTQDTKSFLENKSEQGLQGNTAEDCLAFLRRPSTFVGALPGWRYLYAVDNFEENGSTTIVFLGSPLGFAGDGIVCFSVKLDDGDIDFLVFCHAAKSVIDALKLSTETTSGKIILNSRIDEFEDYREAIFFSEVVPQIRKLLD